MIINPISKGGKGLLPEIIVTAPSGSTLDLMQGGVVLQTYTLSSTETQHTFIVKNTGTYTVRGTSGSDTASVEVVVDVVGIYNISIRFVTDLIHLTTRTVVNSLNVDDGYILNHYHNTGILTNYGTTYTIYSDTSIQVYAPADVGVGIPISVLPGTTYTFSCHFSASSYVSTTDKNYSFIMVHYYSGSTLLNDKDETTPFLSATVEGDYSVEFTTYDNCDYIVLWVHPNPYSGYKNGVLSDMKLI